MVDCYATILTSSMVLEKLMSIEGFSKPRWLTFARVSSMVLGFSISFLAWTTFCIGCLSTGKGPDRTRWLTGGQKQFASTFFHTIPWFSTCYQPLRPPYSSPLSFLKCQRSSWWQNLKLSPQSSPTVVSSTWATPIPVQIRKSSQYIDHRPETVDPTLFSTWIQFRLLSFTYPLNPVYICSLCLSALLHVLLYPALLAFYHPIVWPGPCVSLLIGIFIRLAYFRLCLGKYAHALNK